MDPVTHTFTGAALAAAGLRKVTPLASATLILAANAPDVDVLAYAAGPYAAGPYAALAFRRGWTHGPLALVILPCLVAGGMLAYDRAIRRRRRPAAVPARAAPFLGLAALGVTTHPFLDWLNNYGIRWLMPFDGRWFYGDAVFIMDPWIWLALGGALFLISARSRVAIIAWAALAVLASSVILLPPFVPFPAKLLWMAGVVGLAVTRRRMSPERRDPARAERVIRRATIAVGVYIVVMLAATAAGRARVQTSLESAGLTVESLMVAPSLANPFTARVVVATPDAYHQGTLHWLRPASVLLSPRRIVRRAPDRVARAAMETPEARHYLTWARFPFVETEAVAGGHLVRIQDARYAGAPGVASLQGVTVQLDAELEPVPLSSPRPISRLNRPETTP